LMDASRPSSLSAPSKVWVAASPTSAATLPADDDVKIYPGFDEHAHRLLVVYGTSFAPLAPVLQVVLPSGVVENEKALTPKEGAALIAYPYPQSIADAAVARKFLDSPFVHERTDGSFAVMQVWPVVFNDKFQAEFQSSTTNPDTDRYSEKAVADLRRACEGLFGAAGAELPVHFCHRAARNDRRVFVGTRTALLRYLRAHSEVVAELNIASLRENGFVAKTVDGRGESGTKDFTMADNGVLYALYTKLGWHTMACVTPLDQFERDRELLPPACGGA